jgi:hypothetical protein
MRPGTVLFFKDFRFKDGSSKDKLVIILNNPQGDDPFLLCPTTSQQYTRKRVLGCYSSDNYFFIDSNQDNFKKDTWVVFHNIYSYSAAAILSSSFAGQISQLFEIEPSLWSVIKNCILRSVDIDQDYLELIQNC